MLGRRQRRLKIFLKGFLHETGSDPGVTDPQGGGVVTGWFFFGSDWVLFFGKVTPPGSLSRGMDYRCLLLANGITVTVVWMMNASGATVPSRPPLANPKVKCLQVPYQSYTSATIVSTPPFPRDHIVRGKHSCSDPPFFNQGPLNGFPWVLIS